MAIWQYVLQAPSKHVSKSFKILQHAQCKDKCLQEIGNSELQPTDTYIFVRVSLDRNNVTAVTETSAFRLLQEENVE